MIVLEKFTPAFTKNDGGPGRQRRTLRIPILPEKAYRESPAGLLAHGAVTRGAFPSRRSSDSGGRAVCHLQLRGSFRFKRNSLFIPPGGGTPNYVRDLIEN